MREKTKRTPKAPWIDILNQPRSLLLYTSSTARPVGENRASVLRRPCTVRSAIDLPRQQRHLGSKGYMNPLGKPRKSHWNASGSSGREGNNKTWQGARLKLVLPEAVGRGIRYAFQVEISLGAQLLLFASPLSNDVESADNGCVPLSLRARSEQ